MRVIDQNNNQLGILPTGEALRIADEAGLDLVEVAPQDRPPVCRIMDYGKWKYEQKKNLKQRHGVEQQIKEVRMRPKTDIHDRQIKVGHAREFLEKGYRVQFTMVYRGRERFHQDIGYEAFREILAELADVSKVDQPPRQEGRRMSMLLASTVTPSAKPKPAKTATPSDGKQPPSKDQAPDEPIDDEPIDDDFEDDEDDVDVPDPRPAR